MPQVYKVFVKKIEDTTARGEQRKTTDIRVSVEFLLTLEEVRDLSRELAVSIGRSAYIVIED